MNQPLIIDYYSDILCVWAWVAQQRIEELNQKLENKIHFKYHYLDVFGDVQTKIETQWKQKGQYNGFAEHVHKSASIRDDVPTNSKIWTEVRPTTSANAHLVLKAIELIYDKNTSIDMALKFRSAFLSTHWILVSLKYFMIWLISMGWNRKKSSQAFMMVQL